MLSTSLLAVTATTTTETSLFNGCSRSAGFPWVSSFSCSGREPMGRGRNLFAKQSGGLPEKAKAHLAGHPN